MRAALGAVCFGLAGACAGPILEVTADPPDAAVYVDGRKLEDGLVPFRYYGTVALDGLPAVGEEAPVSRAPTRQTADLPEPVTPWIFPFDFPGELLVRLFGGVPDRQVRVELPPNPIELVEGLPPVDAAELSQRAHAARIAR